MYVCNVNNGIPNTRDIKKNLKNNLKCIFLIEVQKFSVFFFLVFIK